MPMMPLRLSSSSRTLTMTRKQLNQIQAHFIKSPQPHILNPVLGSLTYSRAPQNALYLYNLMLRHPTSYNHYTFTYAIKACSFLLDRIKGLEIHATVLKSGHFSDVYIQNSFLHFYLLQKDVSSADRVFASIDFPDVVSWSSIISGLSKCGFEREAIDKFASMDLEPNCSTLVSALSASCSIRAVKYRKVIHSYVLRNLNVDNIILGNAILEFYIRCGSLSSAHHLFLKMPKRDVVSWSSLIGGYAVSGSCEEAVELFQQMVSSGEAEPNEFTLVNALSACSSSGKLAYGELIHTYIASRHDISLDGPVGNALINMFVKCGNMDMAVSMFNKLGSKDMISWSTIISGLALNSTGIEALQLFSLMLVHGVALDDITFIALLTACSHSGLVRQGLMLFEAMKTVYGITPQMQHFACMVDMYGRAGLLEEAEEFIREMPVVAEGSVWGALLNACKIHGDETVFERIRDRIGEARGVSIGTMTLLSNTYARWENWEDANKVRDEMRSEGLKKVAGSSRVEVASRIDQGYDDMQAVVQLP